MKLKDIYRENIFVPEQVLEVANMCLDLGLKIDSLLGCGDFGCAFLLENGNVLKLTVSPPEYEIAEYISKLKNVHPGIPKIYNLYEFENCHPYEDVVYAIERDEIQDIKWNNLESVKEALDLLNEKIEDTTYYQKISEERMAEDGMLTDFLLDIFQEVKLHWEDEVKIEEVADLWEWAFKNKIKLHDSLVENLGVRGDQIMIRDFGYFILH
jgi:hypothetical protein